MKRLITTVLVGTLIAFGTYAAAQEQETQPNVHKKIMVHRQGLKEELNLTKEQENKLQALRQAGQTESKAISEQMQKIRQEMLTLRKDDKIDTAKINPLIDKMYKLRADQAKSRLQRKQEWRKIFTAEQLEKLKDRPMMVRGFRSMGPGMMQGRFFRGPIMMRRHAMRQDGCQCPCQCSGHQGQAEMAPPAPPAPPAPLAPPAPDDKMKKMDEQEPAPDMNIDVNIEDMALDFVPGAGQEPFFEMGFGMGPESFSFNGGMDGMNMFAPDGDFMFEFNGFGPDDLEEMFSTLDDEIPGWF